MQVAYAGTMSFGTSILGGQLGQALHIDRWFIGIQSPLLNNILTQTTSNILIGAPLSGAAQYANGGSFWEGTWSGVKMGAFTGVVSGIGSAATYSIKYDRNFLTGKPVWPENNGALGYEKPVILPTGTKIDRYGDKPGNYFAPAGTPFENRSLPQEYINKPIITYETTRPMMMWESTTAPHFNQPGFGTQYRNFYNSEFLYQQGWFK